MSVAEFRKAITQEKFIEIGTSGLKHWGGVLDEEFLRELRGPSGVKVYREMAKNDAVIGASLFAYTTLAKEVTFQVDAAPSGGRRGDEIAEFVRGALFDDMAISWRDLLGEIFSFLTYGWAYLEVVYKRRTGETGEVASRFGWREKQEDAAREMFWWMALLALGNVAYHAVLAVRYARRLGGRASFGSSWRVLKDANRVGGANYA